MVKITLAKRLRQGCPWPSSDRATSHHVAMMPDLVARPDCDEIEAEREPWHLRSIGQPSALEQAVCRSPDPDSLAMINGLLGQTVLATGPPADLDDDERRGWARVDGDDIDLVAADVDVPGQDGPAGFDES